MDSEALVRQTGTEDLFERIEQFHVENRKMEEENENYRKVAKAIASVYFYLRQVKKMPAWEITAENIKEVHKDLTRIAQERMSNRWKRFWDWHYWRSFYEYGYFGPLRTPCGKWGSHTCDGEIRPAKHPWEANWYTFTRETQLPTFGDSSFSIPKNFKELMGELLACSWKPGRQTEYE